MWTWCMRLFFFKFDTLESLRDCGKRLVSNAAVFLLLLYSGFFMMDIRKKAKANTKASEPNPSSNPPST